MPRVELLSPKESKYFIDLFKEKDHSSGVSLNLKGEFDAICREESTNEVVWSVKQSNIVTDMGLNFWIRSNWYIGWIVTHPSSETPDPRRTALGVSNAAYRGQSSQFSWTNNSTTHQKSYAVTLSAPSLTRTIGTIGIGFSPGSNFETGQVYLYSYALLSPPKTQTTSQTLEIAYRITATAIG